MLGMLKISKTVREMERHLSDFYITGARLSFEYKYAARVPGMDMVEKPSTTPYKAQKPDNRRQTTL